MSLSWTFALANNLKIDLEAAAWKKFPGVCPYCGRRPCDPLCNSKERPEKLRTDLTVARLDHGSFHDFQCMLSQVYPNNESRTSAGHSFEELAEAVQAIDFGLGRHEQQDFELIVSEIVDVIAHICAVASCEQIDLATEMAKKFGNGCPRCHYLECRCNFTTDVAPPIRGPEA